MAKLTVESLGRLLVRQGILSNDVLFDLLKRERERRAGWSRRRSDDVDDSPVQFIVAQNLTNLAGGKPVDDQLIAEVIAAAAGAVAVRLDPIDLDAELIESKISRPFARKHRMMPVSVRDTKLKVAVVDPFDIEALAEYRRLVGQELDIVVAPEGEILRAVNEFYGFRRSVVRAEKDLNRQLDLGNLEQYVKLRTGNEVEASDSHIVAAVDYMLRSAYDARASDIHLEPKRDTALVRFRIDGVLHDIQSYPRVVHLAIVNRIKSLSRLDIAEKRRPQDGRIKTERDGREIELRISTLPVAFGEKVVARIFDPDVLMQDLTGLGFYPDELQHFEEFIARPHGIILVTGPTGSGKTTTLYSALRVLATPDVNVTTVEDPIEMVYDVFNQTQAQPKIGLDFAACLRSILRQDPDILMVGEIRDRETAEMTIQAALTGHLVFSTLHTNDAASSITRLVDLGVEPFLISASLIGVVAQRLLRVVCPRCKRDRVLGREELLLLQLTELGGRRPIVKEGAGCPDCRTTGFRGRTGIFEILPVDKDVRELVDSKSDFVKIRETAVRKGMRSLRQSALRKLAEGITSVEEVIRVTGI
jgi:general secretion pathway protein E